MKGKHSHDALRVDAALGIGSRIYTESREAQLQLLALFVGG
jgi:hypothetical protein